MSKNLSILKFKVIIFKHLGVLVSNIFRKTITEDLVLFWAYQATPFWVNSPQLLGAWLVHKQKRQTLVEEPAIPPQIETRWR